MTFVHEHGGYITTVCMLIPFSKVCLNEPLEDSQNGGKRMHLANY
jgi:hypothetical protein